MMMIMCGGKWSISFISAYFFAIYSSYFSIFVRKTWKLERINGKLRLKYLWKWIRRINHAAWEFLGLIILQFYDFYMNFLFYFFILWSKCFIVDFYYILRGQYLHGILTIYIYVFYLRGSVPEKYKLLMSVTLANVWKKCYKKWMAFVFDSTYLHQTFT